MARAIESSGPLAQTLELNIQGIKAVSQVPTAGLAAVPANVEGTATTQIQPSFVRFSDFSRNLSFKVKPPVFKCQLSI